MAPIKKHLETDLENMHSLPGIEEARTQNIISGGSNKYSGKKKRTIALIVVLVAVVAIAVGFTITVQQNKRSESDANSLASNENGNDDNDDDGVGGDDNIVNNADDQEDEDDERFGQVITFLTNSDISSSVDLQKVDTPQYKAATWISNEDERELDIPESLDEDDSYKFVQRYVMAVFYYALDGPNWPQQASSLTGEATCDWNFDLTIGQYGFESDQTDYDYGVSCWDDDAEDYDDTVTWIFMRTSFLFCTCA